jgi:hypothetical protein
MNLAKLTGYSVLPVSLSGQPAAWNRLAETRGSYEKQDFNQNVRPYTENVRAVAAASQPGGKDGVIRGSVFLLFTEGAFK